MDEYNLSLNECMILSSSKEIAKYFEEVVSLDVSPKKLALGFPQNYLGFLMK